MDGVPGHSDGYNLDGLSGNADDATTATAGFTQLVVRLPAGLDPQRATLAFSYAASAPWLTTERV